MMETKNYEALARHLDQGIMGTPMSPSLIEILKILFPDEEVEVAIKLPMQDKTLTELKAIFPEKGDRIDNLLNGMIKHGTVFTNQKPGKERKYRLLPSVVGWAETPFWAGKDTDTTRKLAPLWLKYREEAFGNELARNDMPVMRVIPVTNPLRNPVRYFPIMPLNP
jgi:hypothetical protein